MLGDACSQRKEVMRERPRLIPIRIFFCSVLSNVVRDVCKNIPTQTNFQQTQNLKMSEKMKESQISTINCFLASL